MARNQVRDKAEEIRYSWKNPPPSITTASSRVEVLQQKVKDILIQLEHAVAEDFHNEGEYRNWYKNAERALKHIQREIHFLNKWISSDGKVTPRPRQEYKNVRIIADDIRKNAENKAKVISRSYIPLYTIEPEAKPKSLAAAQKRMALLTSIKQEIQAAFSEITMQWTENRLNRVDLQGVKAPLQRILTTVEKEITAVKSFIQQASMAVDSWKVECLKIIQRAQQEGFILTNEEKETVRRIEWFINK